MKRANDSNLTVTMKDVAKASGFSPATVSIVLNNAPLARYIAPATKKRIEEIAKKLNHCIVLLMETNSISYCPLSVGLHPLRIASCSHRNSPVFVQPK